MENKKTILSICIPTYNRAEVLKISLAQLVQLEEFNDEVEVIISDNASTDNTEKVANYFVSKFHNIKYFKNEQNVRDLNFVLAMNRGTGSYIKLLNDRIQFTNEGLNYIKKRIKEHIHNRIPLFFSDNYIYTKRKAEKIHCNSLDEYIQSISTYVTFIGIFGAWKEQWETIEDKGKYVNLLLCQDDWSYQIVSKGNGCIIYDKKITQILPVNLGIRSGYNWFKVHLDNYYQIMSPYFKLGLIKKETLKQDKVYLFKHFIPELLNTYIYINKNKNFKFETKNTFFYFWKYYNSEWYFYIIILLFPFWWIYFNLIWILKKITPKPIKKTIKQIIHK